MSVYTPLQERLSTLSVPSVRMKFSDIEEIIERALPPSARQYSAWWGNNDQGGKRHSASWLQAGFRAEDLSLEMEEVSFTRVDQPAVRAVFRTGFHVSLNASWVAAGEIAVSALGKLAFPQAPVAAGIYRFRFSGGTGHRCYIGESANLRNRFGFYRQPGSTQATNLRLKALMLEHISGGGRIEVDIITEIGGLTHGPKPTEANLSSKAVRRLFEQAAIVADDATEIESLNR
ncbi:hypothetical protein ACEUZ9_002804 [Paracoccus litorisediminis]|uniref:DUF7662 domain-containing protein n=1 Tax=Paracoccus litorisediminis TaxID=2006130 RepID=UPI003732A3FE